MLVKNILKNACSFIGMNDVINYLNGEVDSSNEIEEKINGLLTALNIANNDIASNYIPIKKVSSVACENNKITFREISEYSILEIYSIKNSNDKIINYSIVSDGVVLDNGDYEIEFSVFPDELNIESEIDYYSKINEVVFAQLVISEYMFLKGFNDEANSWDRKFKNQIQSILRVKKNISIPKRRWL